MSLWLDDLSRQRLHSGNLKDLIDTWHISGVTTNPSIFQAALKDGASYQNNSTNWPPAAPPWTTPCRTTTTSNTYS